MGNRVAVVGVGQTKHKSKHKEVSIAGLVRQAAERALEDAGCSWNDIDALILGKAPDMFEGVVMPELYLTDALGGNGKPVLRVHTAGSVGGSTAVVAASHVQSGAFRRVLTVSFEKQSESNATWALSPRMPFVPHVNAGAGGFFAPYMRQYIDRYDVPGHIGCMVAVKDRLNACKNPYAHLHLPDITVEMVQQSPMLWDPLHFLESCPSSDGACALVLADEQHAARSPNKPAWILGTSTRADGTMIAGKDHMHPASLISCARDVYAKAGITNPRKQIDVAELYVPFSWYEPMYLETLGICDKGEGWKLTESGATSLSGDIPINASGGVLSSNPIGASGMLRFGEAALQVRGMAGEHQVEGARLAIGHAFGGAHSYYAMWAVSSDKP
ncbi:MAG: thiolase domain-containing protein [Pseudomonadales bacterium]